MNMQFFGVKLQLKCKWCVCFLIISGPYDHLGSHLCFLLISVWGGCSVLVQNVLTISSFLYGALKEFFQNYIKTITGSYKLFQWNTSNDFTRSAKPFSTSMGSQGCSPQSPSPSKWNLIPSVKEVYCKGGVWVVWLHFFLMAFSSNFSFGSNFRFGLFSS